MSTENSRQAQIRANIRRLRKRAGLRQEDLASPLGMSVSQLSRIESGENRCYADVILGMAEVLNVDVREFFVADASGEDVAPTPPSVTAGGVEGGLELIRLGMKMIESA